MGFEGKNVIVRLYDGTEIAGKCERIAPLKQGLASQTWFIRLRTEDSPQVVILLDKITMIKEVK